MNHEILKYKTHDVSCYSALMNTNGFYFSC